MYIEDRRPACAAEIFYCFVTYLIGSQGVLAFDDFKIIFIDDCNGPKDAAG